MNLIQWLKSLDELLYEIVSWLVFFPVTLWRVIRRPLTMMDYSDGELKDRPQDQFTDALSPPLFLLLALFLTHGLEVALGGGQNPIVARQTGLASLINDDTSLLVFRLVIFSIFPLMMAVRLVHARGLALTRQRLKAPFYAQCYAVAPFALFLGVGTSLSHAAWAGAAPLGLTIIAITVAFYLIIETRWFAVHLKQSLLRGAVNAAIGFIGATLFVIFVALLFL